MNVSVKPGKLIKGQTGDWEVVIGLEEVEESAKHEREDQEQEPDRADREEDRERRKRWQEVHWMRSWSGPTLGAAPPNVKRGPGGAQRAVTGSSS